VIAEEAVVADAATPADAPALRLVPDNVVSLPDLSGRQLSSVRFLDERIEFDFGGVVVLTTDNPIVSTGLQRLRYPDAGSRDALCGLIGGSVESARTLPGERLELRFANDRQLIVPNIRSRVVTIRSHT
jgi:hypothetical protein